ncbi:conserved hypothetical protein [delta proteobacterium NaphS2]|nr:conserved hypothetical protein [delta proteobacterium NaphS2]
MTRPRHGFFTAQMHNLHFTKPISFYPKRLCAEIGHYLLNFSLFVASFFVLILRQICNKYLVYQLATKGGSKDGITTETQKSQA